MATPSPRTIVSAVRAYAREHDIFRPGPIIVAVSGGTDSVALALILAELRGEFGLVLHVAHFDHRARPRSAAKDAAFAAEIADRIGAPIRAGRAESAPKNEDDARNARYKFLRRAAMQVGAGVIATGHTRDDQAETVLLHLARGSGLAGVAAMRPLRDGVARPLLAIDRAETAAICRAAKIKPREDPSNRSLRFARNRIRLRVLPELERMNPQIRAALARFADAAAQAEESLAQGTKTETVSFAPPLASGSAAMDVPRVVETAAAPSGTATIDIRTLPVAALARDRYLADAWQGATGIALSARQRAALTALAGTTAGTRRIDLPGGQAVREYDQLQLAPPATSDAPRSDPTRLKRGTTAEWHGWRISVDVPTDGMPYRGTVADEDATRLVVRARRPGDRMRGRGKLQDVFVNAKIPARLRDAWPVVTLNGDEVIWVPGVTEPPRSGSVSIAGQKVDPEQGVAVPGKRDAALRNSSENRRVASNSEHRPGGGKRERT